MNEISNPDPEAQAENIVPQHIVDILRYCLRQYGVFHEMTTEDMTSITIEDLVNWCKVRRYPVAHKEAICEHTYDGSGSQPAGSRIAAEAVDTVWKQLQNPFAAVKLLMPIWPWILEKRPPLACRPVMMELTLSLVFPNRTAVQISIATRFDDKPMTSGFLAALVYDQALGQANNLAINGVDAIREQHAQPCAIPSGMEDRFEPDAAR